MRKNVGLTDGTEVVKTVVKWFAERIVDLDEQLEEIECIIRQKCRENPYVENIFEIAIIGESILSGIIAEMGNMSRINAVKEIQKISGMGSVACGL